MRFRISLPQLIRTRPSNIKKRVGRKPIRQRLRRGKSGCQNQNRQRHRDRTHQTHTSLPKDDGTIANILQFYRFAAALRRLLTSPPPAAPSPAPSPHESFCASPQPPYIHHPPAARLALQRRSPKRRSKKPAVLPPPTMSRCDASCATTRRPRKASA